MSKKVTGGLFIFLLFMILSSTPVSPMSFMNSMNLAAHAQLIPIAPPIPIDPIPIDPIPIDPIPIDPIAPSLVANDDSATTDEDVPITIDVMANDNFSGTGLFFVSSVTEPSNGVAVINGDNTVTYAPNQDFFGSDSFLYTVSDSTGLVQDSATVFVTINPVNDPPIANDDSAETLMNRSVIIDVLSNDSDVDDDTLNVTSATSPSKGTAMINQDNTITYIPNQDYFGNDSFDYSISDGNGGTDSATILVVVNSAKYKITSTILVGSSTIDDIMFSPVMGKLYVASDDNVLRVVDTKTTLVEDEIPLRGKVNDMVTNPSTNLTYIAINRDGIDVFNSTNNKIIKTAVRGGDVRQMAVNPNTNIIYTASYFSKLVGIVDGATNEPAGALIGSGHMPFSVSVNPITDKIYAASDPSRPGDDRSLWFVDGSTRSVELKMTNGPAQVLANPNTNSVYAAHSLSYFVSIIEGDTKQITKQIRIGKNPETFAMDPFSKKIFVAYEAGTKIAVIDGASDKALYQVSVPTSIGSIAVNSDTGQVYAAESGSNLIYVLEETPSGPNNPPTASDDLAMVMMEKGATIEVLANDNDPDGDYPMVDSIITPPENGKAVIISDNTITYLPNQNFSGNDSFEYKISDWLGGTDTATVSVIVPDKKHMVVATIGLPSCSPSRVAVDNNASMVYVTALPFCHMLYFINGSTNTVVGSMPVYQTAYDVDVNPDTHEIYVTAVGDNVLWLINGTDKDQFKRISVGALPLFVRANPSTNTVYVSNYLHNTTSVIDSNTKSLVDTITIGMNPTGVGINQQTNMIYVATSADNTVSVIDGSTNSIVDTISVGNNPTFVDVNPNTNFVYVTNLDDATVSVIDGSTNSVVNTIPIGHLSGGLVVNPVSNLVYTTHPYVNTISVIDGIKNIMMGVIDLEKSPNSIDIDTINDILYVTHTRGQFSGDIIAIQRN